MILQRSNTTPSSIWADRHPGRHHRAGLLQRQPAAGHQGRRAHRRAGSHAAIINEPTASSLAYGLDKKVDQRMRSTTWAAAPSTSVLDVGDGVLRSNPPTATPSWAATTSTSVINWIADEFRKGAGASTCAGPDGLAAPGEARKGQDRAVTVMQTEINLPFYHHRRRQRPQAFADDALAPSWSN